MKICSACGSSNSDDNKFCMKCGQRLPDQPAVQPVAVDQLQPMATETPAVEPQAMPQPAAPAYPAQSIPPMPAPAPSFAPAPASDPKRKAKRLRVVIIAVIVAVLIAAGCAGFVWYRHTQQQRALADCTSVLADANKASKTDDKTYKSAQQVYSSSEADKATLQTLGDTLDSYDQLPLPDLQCSADTDAETLKQTTDRLRDWRSKHDTLTAQLNKEMTTVKLKDSQTALETKLKDASALLESAKGKVDDESTLTALQQAVDKAEKLKDGSDTKAMDQATGDLSALIVKVNDSVSTYTAKQDASRCTALAGSYYDPQGISTFIVQNDCSVKGYDGNPAVNRIFDYGTYVSGSYAARTDGTATWKTTSTEYGDHTWTLYPAGMRAPSTIDAESDDYFLTSVRLDRDNDRYLVKE
ncbi:colicin transporter [Bifidobacterium goeldii]|uniref:Colicin transporter n=1 Tax=Bifidobacterium goeldii TaxID=2306975 RepID=A0A430FM12_9BIFI|nr:zinc-ribbon domain-containing protein [Bifidobacterium goeldii]RSX53820.1 colicin transporter [Bifidobacterium goeldii]